MIIFDFWLISFLIIFIICGVVSSESENFLAGTVTFIVGLSTLQWLFNIPVLESIVANPIIVLLYLAIYTILGSVYTLLWRWPEFLRDKSESIKEDYARYIKTNATHTKEQYFASRYYSFSAGIYYNSIATWVLTWPFSLAWELSRKPVRYMYKLAYNILGDMFERVGRAVSSKIIK